MARYPYIHAKTRERAQEMLEQAYAEGDIVPGEFPRVEPQYAGGTASWDKRRIVGWVVTLGDND